jgi:hypothetical protein
MRRTKNTRQALERLADYLGVELVPVTATRWTFIYGARWNLHPRTTNQALAFLADYARRAGCSRERVQAAVKWYGNPYLSGIPAWGAESLRWLKMEVES